MSRSSQGQRERAPYAEKSDKNNNNKDEARGKMLLAKHVAVTAGEYTNRRVMRRNNTPLMRF